MRSIDVSLLDEKDRLQTLAPVAGVLSEPGATVPKLYAAEFVQLFVSDTALTTLAVTVVLLAVDKALPGAHSSTANASPTHMRRPQP